MSNVIQPVGTGNGLSRRDFLRGTGAVAGAVALGAVGLTPAQRVGAQIAAAAGLNSDMDILMFALTLEHVEDAAYRAANASGLLSGEVADLFRTFGEHEHTHVVALTDVITKLGGTPVQEQAGYSLPKFANQNEVVIFFGVVEEVGAGAYLGAAPLLKNKDLLSAAASIHNVEAQHASTLHAVLNESEPSPAFGKALTYDEVIAAVSPLLAMPGMPTTGAPAPALGGPLLAAAALFATAVGLALRVRGRETEINTPPAAE